MAKGVRLSPRKKKASSRASPYTSHSGKKGASPSAHSSSETSRAKISYEKNGRTDLIIDWLTENVNDRIPLFSDNAQDASAEGRRLRTAKTSKLHYYRKIAASIFENDPEEMVNYAQDPERYAKSRMLHSPTCLREVLEKSLRSPWEVLKKFLGRSPGNEKYFREGSGTSQELSTQSSNKS
jgi:hypothetical protein